MSACRAIFVVSGYGNPIGELSARIANAVAAAQEEIGASARMGRFTHEKGILGHIYSLEFIPGERDYHPLQVENAIYQQLRPTLEINL